MEYHICREGIICPVATHPEGLYDLIMLLDEHSDYRDHSIATYSTLSDALAALDELQCSVQLKALGDKTICMAEMVFIEEKEVVDKARDHYLMTGNRWFARLATATTA